MTGCEVRVEAWLRCYLPEGPVESFTPQQQRVHNAGLDWRDCFESYGEEHGATLGCLLALVREAWGLPGIHAFIQDDRWLIGEDCDVLLGSARAIYSGSSEAEALVAALEAAPS